MTLRTVALLFTLVLSACINTGTVTNRSDTINAAQAYLQKARNAKGPERNDWLLKAIEALLASNRPDKALSLFPELNPDELAPNQSALYHSLLGQALHQAGHDEEAIQQFARVTQPELLAQDQLAYYDQYATSLNNTNRYFESAVQRMKQLESSTDSLDNEAIKEMLWASLMNIPHPEIYQNSLNSRLVAGWLDLAIIARQYDRQPEKMIQSLTLWKSRYADHPANLNLPLDLARAMSVQVYHPGKIAVLLPASGPLAKSAESIKRGILKAHYDAADTSELTFYDTGNSDINALYQTALDEGAQFVIGPLKRDLVAELEQRENLPVPVLSINRLNDEAVVPAENFYQFGLPIEDEATQAANHISEDGLSRGLLLLPEGNQGDRLLDAFSRTFEDQGGEIRNVVRYRGQQDFASTVRTLLGVDKSIQRHTRLEQIIGKSLEFQARRRKDVDFILFSADPTAGRRIKPFVDYYYAHDLALYATSSVYQGSQEASRDTDLDKVIFCDMPLLISDAPPMLANRHFLQQTWKDSSTGLGARLFALGYDSYQLIPNLNKLRHFPYYQVPGLSGQLSVNELGHVGHRYSWAQFQNGLAKPVTPPRTADSTQSQ